MPRATRRQDGEDIALAYETHTAAGPDASWLVLVHGLGYARWGWEPVLDGLASAFRILTFDNRGIGESSVPPGPYSTPVMAEDLLAVMDEAGVDRPHVVATSLGGMVAQELAIAQPERVDRLVLVCTTPGGEVAHPFPEPTQRLLAEMPQMEPRAGLERAVRNALGEDPPKELVQTILAHRLAAPPDPAGWQAQAAAGATHDAAGRLERIDAPTLIVHGTADVVVDPRNADLLAERIPEAEVVRFEGAGHLLFWEEPERFVSLVDGFLSPSEPGTIT